MILGPLLQSPDVVSFSGGTPAQFVRSMARQGVAPLAIFASPDERLKSFLGLPRKEATPKGLAESAGLLAYEDVLGLSARELPAGFLLRQYYGDYLKAIGPTAKISAKDGKVVVKASDSPWVRVGDLAQLKLSRPLKVHWTYASAFVAVTPGAWPEETILQVVSDAVGAKYVASQGEIELAFDAAKHRQRAATAYADPHWWPDARYEGAMSGFTRPIYVAAANAVSDRDWEIAYRTSNSENRFSVPATSPVLTATKSAVIALSRYMARTNQTEQASRVSANLDRFNTKVSGQIQLCADGRIFGEIQMGDSGKEWFSFG